MKASKVCHKVTSFYDQNNEQGAHNLLAPYLEAQHNPQDLNKLPKSKPADSTKPGYKYFDLSQLDASSILDSSVADEPLSDSSYPLIAYEDSFSLEHFNPSPKANFDNFNRIPPAKVGHASPLRTAPVTRDKLFNFEAPVDELPSLVSQLFSEYDVKLEKSEPAVPVTTAAPLKKGGFDQLDKHDKNEDHSGRNVFIQKIEIGPGNFAGDNFGRDFFSGASALRRFKPRVPGGKAVNTGSEESGKDFYFHGPSPYGKVVKGNVGGGGAGFEDDDESLAGFGSAGIDSLFGFGKAAMHGAANPEPDYFNPLLGLF